MGVVVGFDFGTTNSLISVAAGDRAINVLDEDGRPVPSVVGYEGVKTLVGREARDRLDKAGLGVHDNIVRSPKTLLGEEVVHVGGVGRSPVDLVATVVSHVKQQALETRVAIDLDGVREAVVTIPINMTGPRRRALREAFGRAGIRVKHFIHEPFAALYGYFRTATDREVIRRYRRQLVLVVDWGGGTLDLTLCHIGPDRITQIANHGTEEVGGDHFDTSIRNAVLTAYAKEYELPDDVEISDDARARLLQQCERAKIALSDATTYPMFGPSFFEGLEEDFDHPLGRQELDAIGSPLIADGIGRIRTLLDRAGVGTQQVAMCLATGGMTLMPAIRSRLHELFGPNCVKASDRSATLIAEGAAWVASDQRRLTLAKTIELGLARNSFLPLLYAGTEMPFEGSAVTGQAHLYCADPRDGLAKFQFLTPKRPALDVQLSEPRESLGNATVKVDPRAKPFQERLELDVVVDHDLILTASARSLNAKDQQATEVHDLEFGLPVPFRPGDRDRDADAHDPLDDVAAHEPGALVVRDNVASEPNDALVPGELLYEYKPGYFEVARRPPQVQTEERLYYQPCAVCKRPSNDPACTCGSGTAGTNGGR